MVAQPEVPPPTEQKSYSDLWTKKARAAIKGSAGAKRDLPSEEDAEGEVKLSLKRFRSGPSTKGKGRANIDQSLAPILPHSSVKKQEKVVSF